MIKNGCRCEAEHQRGATVALSRRRKKKKKEQLDCCLDVALIDGLLIIAGEQSVLSDKLGEFA